MRLQKTCKCARPLTARIYLNDDPKTRNISARDKSEGGENYNKCQLETTIAKRTREFEKVIVFINVLRLNKSVSTECVGSDFATLLYHIWTFLSGFQPLRRAIPKKLPCCTERHNRCIYFLNVRLILLFLFL